MIAVADAGGVSAEAIDWRQLAADIFGDRLALARRYAALLADVGVAQGLIGPREVDRLWERHLINCALVTELLPADARVVDVGSGAGLPGIALVCRRADVRVDLVESMQRRVVFLNATLDMLELNGSAKVVHGRAEDAVVRAACGESEWVTARAVAPLARLATWCLPLLVKGGRLLAIKGDRAADELEQDAHEIRRIGGSIEGIVQCGVGVVPQPATVVVIAKR